MIHYGGSKPLKIEISYREKQPRNLKCINGVITYNIERILSMKMNAYNQRDKLRDLFDVVFIGNKYWDSINDTLKDIMIDSFEYKGIEYFDYLMNTQEDELIDKSMLAEQFMILLQRLNLM